MGKEINAILGTQTIIIWTYDFIINPVLRGPYWVKFFQEYH